MPGITVGQVLLLQLQPVIVRCIPVSLAHSDALDALSHRLLLTGLLLLSLMIDLIQSIDEIDEDRQKLAKGHEDGRDDLGPSELEIVVEAEKVEKGLGPEEELETLRATRLNELTR